MNKFKNKGLFILLTLVAFAILALASYKLSSYTLSKAPTEPKADQNER